MEQTKEDRKLNTAKHVSLDPLKCLETFDTGKPINRESTAIYTLNLIITTRIAIRFSQFVTSTI